MDHHIVTQIVKSEFVIRTISHIRGIGGLPFCKIQSMDDQPHRQPQKLIDLTHPLTVTTGQIVIHRNKVNAFSCQRIEIDRQRSDKRLSFACLHFGNLALVQGHAAKKLHIEMPHPGRSDRGFPHDGKSLWQQNFERLPVIQPLPEFHRLRRKRSIA